MADVKISELTALTTPDGAEELVVNDSGTTKKITVDNITQSLNHSGTTKLATTSTGVDVTGTVTSDGLTVTKTGDAALFTNASDADLKISLTSSGTLITPSTGILRLGTSNTERARIDSSGNLLVGTTSTYPGLANTVSGVSISSNALWASRSGNVVGSFNRNTNDGDIVQLRKDGATVGSIGSKGGELTIGTGDTGLVFNAAGDTIIPFNMSTNGGRDGAIDLGIEAFRFKDAFLSGGVYLGGTGAANKLDDYETGTFTPVTEGTTTAGVGTYTVQDGIYTKIGDLVTAIINIGWSAHTGTGATRITGLPFVNVNTHFASATVRNDGATTNGQAIQAYVVTSASRIELENTNLTTGNASGLSIDSSVSRLMIVATYKTTG